MPPVRGPEPADWGYNSNNRIEKTPYLVDDVSQAFVMRVRKIALKGCRLNGIYRQDCYQHGVAAKRFFV